MLREVQLCFNALLRLFKAKKGVDGGKEDFTIWIFVTECNKINKINNKPLSVQKLLAAKSRTTQRKQVNSLNSYTS